MSEVKQHYEQVGSGWKPILQALDAIFDNLLDNHGLQELKILQVKEKFGGLRVYTQAVAKNPEDQKSLNNIIHAYVSMAGEISFLLCEECGDSNVTTAPIPKTKLGWTKTLCPKHRTPKELIHE